jgi:hypothetical protein
MRKWLRILAVFLLISSVALVYFFLSGREEASGAKPVEQPVAFSHKIHAGDNQIPCQYCHAYADNAAHPGVPSLKACMGCHQYILGEDRNYDYNGKSINFKTEIQKVRDYWSRQEPIVWNRYHFVPEHAHFKHEPHIRAGLDCAQCHGQVENVDLVVPVHKIEMGWCISCHRQNQKTDAQMAELAKEGKELVYLRDCYTCHY